jgi:hypothetical protein
MERPVQSKEMSLQPQFLLKPFDQLALDFVGMINPSSHHNSYILVCTDYVTKWMEAKSLPDAIEQVVVRFLHEEIFTRFGIPQKIDIDGGMQFTSRLIRDLMEKYRIKHRVTTPYHRQDNRHVEGTNKILETIITNTNKLHLKDWADKLPEALWAYRKIYIYISNKKRIRICREEENCCCNSRCYNSCCCTSRCCDSCRYHS